MDFIFIRHSFILFPLPQCQGHSEFPSRWENSHRMGREFITRCHTNTHIYIYTCRQIIIVIVNPPTCMFLDSGRKTREPRGNSHKHWKNMQHTVQAVTWARGPWSCEAVILPPAPLCHHKKKHRPLFHCVNTTSCKIQPWMNPLLRAPILHEMVSRLP